LANAALAFEEGNLRSAGRLKIAQPAPPWKPRTILKRQVPPLPSQLGRFLEEGGFGEKPAGVAFEPHAGGFSLLGELLGLLSLNRRPAHISHREFGRHVERGREESINDGGTFAEPDGIALVTQLLQSELSLGCLEVQQRRSAESGLL
jgi:hypothetical protein